MARSLKEFNTVFKAEKAAMVRRNVGSRYIQICTENQAAIKVLENPEATSRLMREAEDALNALARNNRVIITGYLVTQGRGEIKEHRNL